MNIVKSLFATLLIGAIVLLQTPTTTFAAVADYQQAKVSLTFDDGFLSTYTNALPILSARHLPATVYVTSGFIDQGKVDDDNLPAMTWAQVQALQNTNGWEIGGHTQTHTELPLLTQAQIAAEFANSNAAFASSISSTTTSISGSLRISSF